MSELDFDELDKAVNTLMSDVPKVEPPKTDDIKTLNITSTLPDESRPSLAQLDSALTQVNGAAERSTSVAPTPSLATRRSGRFMDVVHPSSNMKSAPRPTMQPSRQGIFVQPDEKLLPEKSDDQSDVVKAFEETTPVVADQSTDSVTFEPTAAPAVETVHDTDKNDWPDPLDMSGYSAEPSTSSAIVKDETPVTPEVAPADESDDDDDLFTIEGLDDRDAQPLNSPFIADAKVEKRPLGGALVEDHVEEPSRAPVLGVLADDMTAVTDPTDQLPADPSISESQLPPELQSDLMAIETDGGTLAVSNSETATTEVVSQPVVEAVPEVKATASPLVSTGPTSIPQQYHEEQSTSDESNGSIYDTDSYHQPLAHPVKAKSGWLWVIWILLLLIVGGGGAVALYFLGII